MAEVCDAPTEAALVEGVDLDASMTDVFHVVMDPEFKRTMREFLQEHCDDFQLEEENKLTYTNVHQKYVETIEVILAEQLGKERVDSICAALESFLRQHGGAVPPQVAESIAVFAPLWDFQAFRVEMLAAKAQKIAKAAHTVTLAQGQGPSSATVDMSDVLARLQWLEATDLEQGWQRFLESDGTVGDVLRYGDHKCCLRTCVVIELPMDEVVDMMTSLDMAQWMPHVERIDVLQEISDCDIVTQVTFRSGESYSARTLIQPDFPAEGACSYVCVPWDLDGGVGLEEVSCAKVKAGICRPCGAEGQNCLLTTLDYADLGALLNSDLKGAIEYRWSKIPAIAQAYRAAKGLL